MAKTAWGIEAGAATVKAVKLTNDGRGNVTIDDLVVIPLAAYRAGGADESGALLGALRQLVTERGIKPADTAYISLPGRHAFSRVVTLPPVREEAMRETIANEARGQIPIKLEEAVWDYQRISGTEGGEMQVNLYAVKRDVVTSLLNACRAAGLPVKGIQLAPLGVYNFVKYELDPAVANSCVCIDIGAENTDLLVIDGEKTWLRVVPYAGNEVTKALLLKDKRLTPQAAETLKRDPQKTVEKLNKDKPDPIWKDVASVVEAMKPPLKDMVGEIYRSVGYYKNQNEAASLKTLVMMGNGSRLMNLPKFFEQQLQYQVYRIDQLSKVAPGRSLDPAEVQAQSHSLAVPIGLALQAVGVAGLATTNLIPQEMIVAEKLSRLRPLAIAGGALIFVAGLLALVLLMGQQSDVDKQTDLLKEYGKKQSGFISAMSRETGKDAGLGGMIQSFHNVDRGAALTAHAYSLLSHTVTEFTNEKKTTIVACKYKSPDMKEWETGIGAMEVGSELKAPPLPEGVTLPPGTAMQLAGLTRASEVTAWANLAVPLVGEFADANLDSARRKVDEAIARPLLERFKAKLSVILRPQSEVDKDKAAWEASLAKECGSKSDLIAAMKNLREELGASADGKNEAGDSFAAIDVSKIVTLGGQLLAASSSPIDITSIFPSPKENSGKQIDTTRSFGARIFGNPEYYQFVIRLTLMGKPWEAPQPAKPATAG